MRRTAGVLLTLGLLGTASTAVGAVGLRADRSPDDRRSAPERLTDPGQVREIEGGVVISLDSGDRLRIKTSTDYRRTTIQRAVAGGSWGAESRLVRKKKLFCGDVKAATSGPGVSLTVMCDRYGYADDQAPVNSQAMVSTDDGRTWASKTIPGEGYEEPAISPAGVAASWPMGQGGFMAWQPDTGYRLDRVKASNQEYTETTTVTDAGVVTYVYATGVDRRTCGLVFTAVAPGGQSARQVLPLLDDSGCGDVGLESPDANTVVLDGDDTTPALRWVATRPDVDAPWVLSTIAPASAPGLEYVERGSMYTQYLSSPDYPDDAPLVAVSARDGRHVVAQAYDDVAQRWAPPAPVYTSPTRCTWQRDGNLSEPAYLAMLRCGRQRVALSSLDGVTWEARPGVRAPVGVSQDGAYAALATSGQVTLLSRELGRVTLPYGVSGRCNLVMPGGPDSAALLTTKSGRRGWPARIRTSGASGWSAGRAARLPTPGETCRRITWESYEGDLYFARGTRYDGYPFTLRRTDTGWRAQVVHDW